MFNFIVIIIFAAVNGSLPVRQTSMKPQATTSRTTTSASLNIWRQLVGGNKHEVQLPLCTQCRPGQTSSVVRCATPQRHTSCVCLCPLGSIVDSKSPLHNAPKFRQQTTLHRANKKTKNHKSLTSNKCS